ncbi:MscS family membrane protein [Dethiosulfatibacter aminovorans DSM 17477]|uniref:MscS family membrane protein n=1 Tax=Dethiosulfatibacter aminovorans DSM 17477 TaxID=1121476 RepID=A0A1M6D0B7_9FIRM|nr:mechanosensitive ion channel family protein [Dethiosulfatibacter aminovorans]SHI66696.1 MscS family membrane protein [Dethiosulfatibacter aminovorans DSM 17477]
MTELIFSRIPTMGEIGKVFLIILIVLVLRRLFVTQIIKWMSRAFKKLKVLNIMIEKTKKPLSIIILATGIFFALITLPFNENLMSFLLSVYKSLFVFMAAQTMIRIVEAYFNAYVIKRSEDRRQKQVNTLISKIIKLVVIIIAILIILTEFDVKVQSLLAGIGISGIAFALAAQDTLKNIFGGIIIYMDSPFNIGDIIIINNIEGIVEDIGLRSTKLRAFDKGLVSMPNAAFTDGTVHNYSRRGSRRQRHYVGVTYSTKPEKIRKIISGIKELLISETDVENDGIIVRFEKFGGSSLDILISYYATKLDYNEFMEVVERINLKIMELFHKEEVDFAFPSMSLYFENELKKGMAKE